MYKKKEINMEQSLCHHGVSHSNPLPVSNHTRPIRTKHHSSQYHQNHSSTNQKNKWENHQRKVTNARSLRRMNRTSSSSFSFFLFFFLHYFFKSTDTGSVWWRGRHGGAGWWFWRLQWVSGTVQTLPQVWQWKQRLTVLWGLFKLQ